MYRATHLQNGEAQSSFATLDLLGSLCNKSLLRQEDQSDGEPRFIMLETVREFALDRLRMTDGEAEARRAHSAYYLSLAERAATQLRGPAQAEWLDRLEREYANCRIAIDTALAEARSQSPEGLVTATRLAIALHRLWLTRGPLLEGVEYLRRVIAAADDAALRDTAHDALDIKLRAGLLSSAGQLANTRSVFPEAHDLFARSLVLHREAGDDAGVATTLNNLAWSAWIIGDMTAGEQMATAAMAMHEKSGDALGATLSLNTLGWIAMERGQYPRAETYFANAVASQQQRGDRRAAAFTLGWIGVLADRRGDYSRAIELHQRAIDMLEPVADHGYRVLSSVRLAAARHSAGEPGDHTIAIEATHLPELREQGGRLWPIAYALTELGAMLRDNGRYDHARQILDEALDVRRQTGGLHGVADAHLLLGTVLHAQGDTARAWEELECALITARDFGAVPVAIDCIEAIATLTLAPDRPERAATLLAAAAHGREALGAPRAPCYETAYEQSRASLRSMIGDTAFARAWQSGVDISVDDAITLALHADSDSDADS
jgi:tetratricopeptide (TPR) repeat protein